MNLFRPLWFTWKGKDGYGGGGGYLQIKIFYFLLTKKNTGEMARAQGKHIWYSLERGNHEPGIWGDPFYLFDFKTLPLTTTQVLISRPSLFLLSDGAATELLRDDARGAEGG